MPAASRIDPGRAATKTSSSPIGVDPDESCRASMWLCTSVLSGASLRREASVEEELVGAFLPVSRSARARSPNAAHCALLGLRSTQNALVWLSKVALTDATMSRKHEDGSEAHGSAGSKKTSSEKERLMA